MIHWATLNKGVVLPETDPSEIQIEQFLKQYHQALQLHQKGRLEEAKSLYERIINDDLVENGPETTDPNQNLTMTNSSLVMLRFLVYKNYAMLLKHEFDTLGTNDVEKGKEAIKYFLMALDIDETEQSLWYRVGQLAQATGNARLARLAYEHGLYIIGLREKYPKQFDEDKFNSSTGSILDFWKEVESLFSSGRISPIQWRCMEGLCEILTEIGDHEACSAYMKLASQYYPNWPLLTKLEHARDTYVVEEKHEELPPAVRIKVSKPEWSTLLKALIDSYNELTNSGDGHNPLYNDVPVVNRALHIHVTARESNNHHNDDNRSAENVDDDIQIPDAPPESDAKTASELQQVDENRSSEPMETNDDEEDKTPAIETTSQHESEKSPVPSKESSKATSEKVETEATNIQSPSTPPKETNDATIVSVHTAAEKVDLQSSTTAPEQIQSGETSIHPSSSAPSDATPVSGQPKSDRVVIDLSMDDDDIGAPALSTANVETETKGLTTDMEKNEDQQETKTLKRKRSDQDDAEQDDEDDGDEEEDKRATLRASKRQKEKVENEESSRRKMLEEEEELSNSIQKVFDKLAAISGTKREKPWYIPVAMSLDDPTLSSFWRWFDAKVSELDRRYAWDYERSGGGIDLTLPSSTSEGKRGPQYAIFATTDTHLRNPAAEEMAVLNLIDSLNIENSGVTDSLLHATLVLLEEDAQSGLDPNVADLLVDTIVLLEQNFLQQYLFKDSDIITEGGNTSTLKLVLRICERMMDRLIKMILTSMENFPVNPLLRKKPSAAKQAEKVAIRHFTNICNAWIGILERTMMKELTNFFLTNSVLIADDAQALSANKTVLRYWFIRGKMAQCNDEVEKAFDWYKRCEDILRSKLPDDISLDLRCRYDGTLSLSAIEKKLKSLEMGRYMLSARTKFANKEYDSVIVELSDTVESKLHQSPDKVSEISEMLPLLAKSYIEMKEYAKAWKCYIRILHYLVNDLVIYGSVHANDDHIPPKDADVSFFKHMKKIDFCLQEILRLLLDHSVDWPEAVDMSTVDTVLIIIQMTMHYIFRHADFIPLVNNFAIPTADPHVPSQTTRNCRFNTIVANGWVLMATLVQHLIPDSNDSSEIKCALADTLLSLHDELGEREICGVAKGAFLKYLLKLLTQENSTKYRRGIYQCYHCLYGVHLAGESDLIEEHNVAHERLTQKAAEPLFAIVADSVIERLDSGAQLRNDSKDVIDMVSSLFSSLPTQQSNVVKVNKTMIDSYLSRDLKLSTSVEITLRNSLLSAVPIDPKRSDISSVYFKIFWIEGRIIRIQIKNRNKLNPERTMEDLEVAVKLFTNHVTLNPYDISGWAELGHCFLNLAEEEMIWSATNIINHRNLIATYQKKAYHAFCRARNLISSGLSKELDSASMYDLYSNFGFLLYGMTCPPMNGVGFESKAVRRIMTADKQLSFSSPNTTDPKNAYRMALLMFNHALRFKSNEKWRCYIMIGSCCKKLGRPATEVLGWYREAVQKSPAKSGSHGNQEKILEPQYKLYSALVKYLYEGKIQPSDVSNYLDNWPSEQPPVETAYQQQQPSAIGDTGLTINSDGLVVPSQSMLSEVTPAQRPHGTGSDPYDTIYSRLEEVRRSDKRKWHHRPIYRHAWMLYHIYNNANSAKIELLHLFALRSNSKMHINMWRPNYERSGKFFEYVHQYTMFLIKLAKETNDVECLKMLKEKVQKASTILLHSDTVVAATDKAIAETTEQIAAAQQQQQMSVRPASDFSSGGEVGQGSSSNMNMSSDVIIL
ncbi:hypothetical protein BJV82DRAFT_29849 [Fennellomyces sp. T-0311]|nr:hypothetical protein BJV82DRAFT_29849 [Fennellomyces sp. T-0311]